MIIQLTSFKPLKKLTANVEMLAQNSNELILKYNVSSDSLIDDIILPKLKPVQQREEKSELWKSTCFEFFWTEGGSPYKEMNVSPTGDWQFMGFEDYRQRTPKEWIEPQLEVVEVKSTPRSYGLTCQLKGLSQISHFSPTMVLDLGGSLIYFASSHPKDRPDFHDREHWLKLS
jgi:hypothetical protein